MRQDAFSFEIEPFAFVGEEEGEEAGRRGRLTPRPTRQRMGQRPLLPRRTQRPLARPRPASCRLTIDCRPTQPRGCATSRLTSCDSSLIRSLDVGTVWKRIEKWMKSAALCEAGAG
jgi:hypothetical protein